MLAEMAQIYAQRGEVDEAVRSCSTILHLQLWREEAYRQLMGILAEAGRPGEALRVFEECRRALAAEQVTPSPTTWQLRDRITAGLGARRTRQGREQDAATP
jgi:DNA-binding SARP family transcriptional activator